MGEETRAAVRAIEMVERKDRVLIVEDEDNARKGYEQLLQRWGCDVVGVGTAEEALARFASYQPDTLIADVELPGMNGLDLLKQLGPELYDVPAIIITGKGSEERAVAAIEAGAFWYIEKPLKGPVLRALLDRALGKARDARQLAVLQRQLRETGRLGDLVGASKPMQEVMRIVEMAAPSSASVLITGETGSGKEIVARTLHKLSPRGASAASNLRMRERCCWMKSAKCRPRRRRSCCAYWKTAKCGGWGARARLRWTCAFWRQPTKNPRRPSAAATCGKISIFA